MNSSPFTHLSSSAPTAGSAFSGSALAPPTPATPPAFFDPVQICINDVTMVVGDDVSVTSEDDNSPRSGEEAESTWLGVVARRQRRRGSWCPEHSEEKQRRLSVTGRRFDESRRNFNHIYFRFQFSRCHITESPYVRSLSEDLYGAKVLRE